MTAMRCFHHLRRVAADDGHALLPSSAVVSAAAPGFGLPGFGLPGFGLPGFGLPGCSAASAATVDFDPAAADINPDSRPQMFHVELFVLLYLTFHFSMIVNSFN